MTQQEKITVLIPCYNAGKYIREAVDSILNQTYTNLEILLIDDGSKDDTKKIIEAYAESDKRVVAIYNEVNLGLIRTLNKGVGLCTGALIARMDSDDISDLNRIQRLYNAFTENPEMDVISAGYYFLSTQSFLMRRAYPKATSSRALRFVSFFCTPVNHPCVMVRTEVLKAHPFNLNFLHSEDYELFSRLLNEGYKFMNLNDALYYLRINPESVSRRYEQIQISTHMKISVWNIENYFQKKYDYFLHMVLVNRIGFDVSFQLLKSVMETIDSLRDEFIVREQLNASEIIEVNDFITEQRIDIHLQTLKYAKWIRKPLVFVIILFNLKLFLGPRGFRYFRLKFDDLWPKKKPKL